VKHWNLLPPSLSWRWRQKFYPEIILYIYQISRCHVHEYCNVNILTFHVGFGGSRTSDPQL